MPKDPNNLLADIEAIAESIRDSPPLTFNDALERWDLSKQDLADADFSGEDFRSADLSDANFEQSILVDSNLSEAVLTHATLTNADVSRAILHRAKLNHLKATGLIGRGADLSGAQICGFLTDADFSGARFRGAVMEGVSLERSNLTGADLREANLQGANLTHAIIVDADLRGANLTLAKLDWVDFTDTKADNANFHGASLARANLLRTSLRGATLTSLDKSATSFAQADTSQAIWSDHKDEAGNEGKDLKNAATLGPNPIESDRVSNSTDDTELRGQSSEGEVVTQVPTRSDEAVVGPSRDRLLDHMIEESVPIRFRSIIEAGSLIGRRFPFSAAFAAAHPPKLIDEQQLSTQAIKRWRAEADQYWEQLKQVDSDGLVIVCHRSINNMRIINFAQVELMKHIAHQLDDAAKLQCHGRLAQYFHNPIADDSGKSLEDNYQDARASAAHWARANEPRRAAFAERVTAELAEEKLAYPEAMRHYRRAIQHFAQFLAPKEHSSMFKLVDHEDLLTLANCLYRLGQMTRLAKERSTITVSSADPTKYFEQALKRLKELSQNLHNNRLAVPTSEQHKTFSRRNLPEPNLIRHLIRLCETLSGWVNLELAEWCSMRCPEKSRSLLFDALRHAEAARGEADSRRLLAAASAQLAQQLVDDAMHAQQSGYTVRSHNLAIEAQFHIERVIGLAAVSPEEDQNLEEPRSQAWTVLGQLFQSVAIEPQLAYWAFDRMNDHRHKVSDLVDMMTDRRLGLFLLSMHRGNSDKQTIKARELLERHKRWANESGIAHENLEAHLSLALLELVEQSNEKPPRLKTARHHIDQVIDCATDLRQRQDAFLLRGLLHAIEHVDKQGVVHDDPVVIKAFRQAAIEDLTNDSGDEDVLRAGWRTLLVRLLRWCPYIEQWIGLDGCLQEPDLGNERAWQRHHFFSALAQDVELQSALSRAKDNLKSALKEPLMPSSDTTIWRLLESRVPIECYQHAQRTRAIAIQLLNDHRNLWEADDVTLMLHSRDISYAIAVHEWYRSTDPSRLLTLARESNISIDGHEWASPKLLSGRLAIQVLNGQYGAADEIGRQRLRKIESMVTNWTRELKEAGSLEQIFYIAVQLQEPRPSQDTISWQSLAHEPGKLAEAYRLSLKEQRNLVRQAGLPLVQDLHLLDATVNVALDVEQRTSLDTTDLTNKDKPRAAAT